MSWKYYSNSSRSVSAIGRTVKMRPAEGEISVRHEDAFLKAILEAPHDDAPRLIYADWLEEKPDLPRAEYLRLQCLLARTWAYENQQPELFTRLAELRPQLEPGWLAVVRRCTTPEPPVDVAKAVPGLKKWARTAVRLHPRRGTADAGASKIGGLFLWPNAEEWPTCPEHGCPFVPALQLLKEDVPEAGFRAGTDLLQVLWCPNDHDPGFCPTPRLYWRKRSQVSDAADSHPVSSRFEHGYVPEPCVLYSERVIEYPDPFEISADRVYQAIQGSARLLEIVEKLSKIPPPGPMQYPNDPEILYQWWLSTADGTKVGGHPDWVQNPQYPDCSCGAKMEHILTFASGEYDGGTWGRWLPVEDRGALAGSHDDKRDPVYSAPGWMFGDAGCMYLFICRNCKDWPVQCFMQCC